MLRSILTLLLTATLASAHVIITYPGCRGNNFHTNDDFPYGMQWMYPCGGLNLTTNRTYWPTTGGPLAFQPGWFQGHAKALLWVNIGLDNGGPDKGPMNYSTPLVREWQMLGPSNGPFPGTLCFENVPVPSNLGIKAGDNATIQVVEIAAHGASLFGCSDITFVEPGDKRIPPIDPSICFNTQELGAADIYYSPLQKPMVNGKIAQSGAESVQFWYWGRHKTYSVWKLAGWLPVVIGGFWLFL